MGGLAVYLSSIYPSMKATRAAVPERRKLGRATSCRMSFYKGREVGVGAGCRDWNRSMSLFL
jgi:hypothetical protein